jgi:hypothetical protein
VIFKACDAHEVLLGEVLGQRLETFSIEYILHPLIVLVNCDARGLGLIPRGRLSLVIFSSPHLGYSRSFPTEEERMIGPHTAKALAHAPGFSEPSCELSI